MAKFPQDDMSLNASLNAKGGNEVNPKNKSSKMLWLFGIIVILALSAIYVFWGGVATKDAIWQTVFLSNGQAYFGHLTQHGDVYVLSNVFYLRTTNALQPTNPPAQAFDIVKLGGELHGPENVMYVPKTAVLFWENMKPDSQVVQSIENFLKASK